jgi:ornithine decarboxylase
MTIGDLVVGHQMGAYTSATATDFNLFKRAKIVVINKQPSDSAAKNTVAFI